jgi:hypothetical protein
VAPGTISLVTVEARTDTTDTALVSHTGVRLTRATTFRFTLDPTRQQEQRLLAHAGAARLAFNHHLGRVRTNLDQRAAERSYGVAETDLTPSLSWSKVAFINNVNAWKDGRAPDAPVAVLDDGTVVRGLAWRSEVSADVFECASVNAAQALANWATSRKGSRAGRPVGFPRFKSRHKTPPAFRLRATRKAPPRRCARPRRGRCGSRSSACSGSTSTPGSSRRCCPVAASTSTPPASGTTAVAGSSRSPASPPSSTTNDVRHGAGIRTGSASTSGRRPWKATNTHTPVRGAGQGKAVSPE